MKVSKIVVPVLLVVSLVGGTFLANDVQAAPKNQMRNAQNCPAMTPEQNAQVNKLMTAAMEKTKPIRDALYVKKQELIALQNAANPNIDAVSKASKEIIDLRDKLQNERQALGSELDKVLGLPEGTHAYGRGFGYHHNKGSLGGMKGGMKGNCPF